MRTHTAGTLAVTVALALTLAACSSERIGVGSSERMGISDQIGSAATISHIRGLGVDSAGTPYVATPFGLIKAGIDGDWIYAGAATDTYTGFSLHPGDGTIYRSGYSRAKQTIRVESSPDGARWRTMSEIAHQAVDFQAMAVSFSDSKTLWGWSSGSGEVFRSIDGGKSWTPLDAKAIEWQIYVLSGSAEANVVLAGTASGLYRSSDGGATWRAVLGMSRGWVTAIGSNPRDPKHILVFTRRGMNVTPDGGATWNDAGGGLPADASITSLVISPSDAKTAYAANESKIFRTTDGGMRWIDITSGA